MNAILRPPPGPRDQFDAGRQAMLRGLRVMLLSRVSTDEIREEIGTAKRVMDDMVTLLRGDQ